MSSKYKHTNQCHKYTKHKKKTSPKQQLQVILLLVLVLVMLMLLLPPPRPLASHPGQYRHDLLTNMAQGRIQLLRAHHLLTQMLISASYHVIGIRRVSRLVPLPLLCNELLFICWPQKISWKRWQNLRVRHLSVP